jgi:hypothetical protein
MPIEGNRAYLLRKSFEGVERCAGPVLTLGIKAVIDDLSLFQDLGYGGAESIDVSDYEGCTHVHDLNDPVPASLRDRYALTYNGGTLEHIFDVRAVLRNLFAMLKAGGVIVHVGPMNGWVDHGFYQFSPTFFADYYRANAFTALSGFMLKALKPDHSEAEIPPYRYGGPPPTAGSMDGIWNFFMVYRKEANSTYDAIPQQGYYARLYGDASEESSSVSEGAGPFVLRRGLIAC